MKEQFQRKLNDNEYLNSDEAKTDELAIFELEREIKLLGIGPFSAEEFNTKEKELQKHIF